MGSTPRATFKLLFRYFEFFFAILGACASRLGSILATPGKDCTQEMTVHKKVPQIAYLTAATKHYETNSLRIILRNLKGFSNPKNLREKRPFSRNVAQQT